MGSEIIIKLQKSKSFIRYASKIVQECSDRVENFSLPQAIKKF